VKNKECPGRFSTFEHQQLQILLDEDECQSQKRFTISLSVAQQTVSDSLHAMDKILKGGI